LGLCQNFNLNLKPESPNTKILSDLSYQFVIQKSEIILRIALVALVIVAILLAVSLFPEFGTSSGPNLMTVVGLFVTVIVCVSLGSWIAFASEPQHKTSLLISLILGTGVFLLASIFAVSLGMSSPGWSDYYYPPAVYKPFRVHALITIYCLIALTFILAIETLALLIHIIREWRK
jgi:hypothetical protein